MNDGRTGPIWSLNPAKTALTATFRAQAMTLDADGVDELIANLARVRAAMQPPVPLEADPDPNALMQVSPVGRWYVQQMPNYPGVALGLLHPGHRWVWIALPWAQAQNLHKLLHRLTRDQSEG